VGAPAPQEGDRQRALLVPKAKRRRPGRARGRVDCDRGSVLLLVRVPAHEPPVDPVLQRHPAFRGPAVARGDGVASPVEINAASAPAHRNARGPPSAAARRLAASGRPHCVRPTSVADVRPSSRNRPAASVRMRVGRGVSSTAMKRGRRQRPLAATAASFRASRPEITSPPRGGDRREHDARLRRAPRGSTDGPRPRAPRRAAKWARRVVREEQHIHVGLSTLDRVARPVTTARRCCIASSSADPCGAAAVRRLRRIQRPRARARSGVPGAQEVGGDHRAGNRSRSSGSAPANRATLQIDVRLLECGARRRPGGSMPEYGVRRCGLTSTTRHPPPARAKRAAPRRDCVRRRGTMRFGAPRGCDVAIPRGRRARVSSVSVMIATPETGGALSERAGSPPVPLLGDSSSPRHRRCARRSS
jgi:hypothetical protein